MAQLHFHFVDFSHHYSLLPLTMINLCMNSVWRFYNCSQSEFSNSSNAMGFERIIIFQLSLSMLDTQELVDTCVNRFGDEFRNATRSWRPLPKGQRLEMQRNGWGMGAKLIYAFLWQVGCVHPVAFPRVKMLGLSIPIC